MAILEVRRVLCGVYGENAWLVRRPGADRLLIVDPGDGLEALETAIREMNAAPAAILLTHGHFDHTLAAGPLAAKYACPVYVHPLDLDMVEDEALNVYDALAADLPAPKGVGARPYPEGDFAPAGIALQVLHTPGHTPGSCCLYAPEDGTLFSGDTLFAAGYGRMDLPGGSPEDLRRSLPRLLALPEETRVCPGHMGETTIGRERRRYGL